MLKYVILNGPPGCGKDMIADYLTKYSGPSDIEHASFKEELIDITCKWYGVRREVFNSLYTRELKEKASNIFDGKSPRQALIYISEEVTKPLLGKDYFGKAFVSRYSDPDKLYVVSDGGFEEELQPLIDNAGADSILVIKIYRDGCSFEGDSRNYLSDSFLKEKGVKQHSLQNNSTKEYLFKEVLAIINKHNDQ